MAEIDIAIAIVSRFVLLIGHGRSSLHVQRVTYKTLPTASTISMINKWMYVNS